MHNRPIAGTGNGEWKTKTGWDTWKFKSTETLKQFHIFSSSLSQHTAGILIYVSIIDCQLSIICSINIYVRKFYNPGRWNCGIKIVHLPYFHVHDPAKLLKFRSCAVVGMQFKWMIVIVLDDLAHLGWVLYIFSIAENSILRLYVL